MNEGRFLFKLKILFVYFERGWEEEREGEEQQCEREIWSGCLSYAPWLGTEPTA